MSVLAVLRAKSSRCRCTLRYTFASTFLLLSSLLITKREAIYLARKEPFVPLRLLRTVLLLTCLVALASCWSGVAVTRTTTPTMRITTTPIFKGGRIFQPSGQGTALPQMIHTSIQPHGDRVAFVSMSLPPIQANVQASDSASHRLLAPPAVVKVPPPASTDLSAKTGLFQQGGKPDANGVGGLINYVETTNAGVAIFSRSGAPQMRSTYRSWFGVTSVFVDPVAMWDDTGGRFIFSVLQVAAQTIWLSVAQQSNALGAYCNYSFPAPPGHDFDKLGVDSDGVYFGFNVLTPGSDNVVSNELFYASRTTMESCQATPYTDWVGLTNPDGTLAQAITPARQDGSSSGVEYLVNSYPEGACQLTLWALTNSGTLSNTSVPTQCYSSPPNAKQKDSAARIGTGDCSITQASYINGLLTVDTPGAYDWRDGNGPVGIVEWFVLNPSSASVSSQGAFGTPGYWLFYPSAIMTPNGHMLFVYNASGSRIYPSVWYVNQTFTGTMTLANGTGPYTQSEVSPWGDYQSAWPDASGGTANAVWITGEFAKANHVWGTRFDLVTP